MDELTRRNRIAQEADAMLAKGQVMVVLTGHFLQQSFQRGMRWKGFHALAAKLALLAKDDLEIDHMAVVGSHKIVYVVRQIEREARDPLLNVIFKTVMPRDFKHNPLKSARTIRVGEVT